ncbi:hypothetical protein RI054_04g20320 [Pseudoscourfieldia marina]
MAARCTGPHAVSRHSRLCVRSKYSTASTSKPLYVPRSSARSDAASATQDEEITADVVVVGAGVGGLCCAALLAEYGFDVAVVEAHDVPGGCAHAFERNGYTFDSGPSFFSGISSRPSTNPLGQVLHALDIRLPTIKYDAWDVHLPDGEVFRYKADGEAYRREVSRVGGPEALAQWQALERRMDPLAKVAGALPAAALRWDITAAATVFPYLPGLMSAGPAALFLQKPFAALVDDAGVKNSFLRSIIDLECFVLSGMKASGTITAEMAFMFMERNGAEGEGERSAIEYPIGGAGAVVDALVDALKKRGGSLHLRSAVEEIVVSDGRAVGVRTKAGRTLHARKAVISNASTWDTFGKLVKSEHLPPSWRRERTSTPMTDSFMHLHVGFDKSGLPDDLECHHIVVNDMEDISTEQNVVAISIPSVFDPNLAPEGKHLAHIYTAGNEPYSIWEGLDRRSDEYRQLKEQRSEVLWRALEKVVPDIRSRVDLSLVGTPLTHERFNRRSRGSYGPAISAAESSFPGPDTPIVGLYCCGDSTQPGIGLPAVAASGMIAANTIAPLDRHMKLLERISG